MRKIKWGVLGTANIARSCTIPGMQLAENCELYAIAGRSLEKAEQFRTEFGFEKAVGSYEELLADPAVEAVYIPLPNTLHCDWTIRAERAGKHVLCEKPLAPSAEKAAEMQNAARENGVLRTDAEFNQAGRLSYQIITDGQIITRYVDVPHNYSLEIAQLGRCITFGELPHVSADFTLATARTMDKALAAIGY